MVSALVVSQVILWIVVVALALVCMALLRQVGVLHERMLPFGAMMSDRGPDVGDAAPEMQVRDTHGNAMQLGGPSPEGKVTLLLFVAATCPICKKLLPLAKRFAHEERISLVLVGDGEADLYQNMVENLALQEFPLINSPGVGMRYHVGKIPYAVLIDKDGVIRSKGLVNSREHLESLIVAKEMGFGSINAFLQKQQQKGQQKKVENVD